MTKIIETLDALCGCGKTTAIFKEMSRNRQDKWLYLSPMKAEIRERVPIESEVNALEFFIAEDSSRHIENKAMTAQVLQAFKEGMNVACTHALMMRFTDEHLEAIKQQGYSVVCDEELDLIKGYNGLRKGDVEFLLNNNHIKIDDTDGKITFLTNIGSDTAYSNAASLANMECLYSAKSRNSFLITQISPRLIDVSKRFILLTYLYKGSIMDTFMQMHGYQSKELKIELLYSEKERIQQIRNLVQFIEPKSLKELPDKMTLSASWWKTASRSDIQKLEKVFTNIVNHSGVKRENIMHTLPKLNHDGNEDGEKVTVSRVFSPARYDTENSFVPFNARATNMYRHKELAIHLLNVYPNLPVTVYMQDMRFICNDENHALSTFVQWLFRSCIRDGKQVKVAIASKRMSLLFKQWLSRVDIET